MSAQKATVDMVLAVEFGLAIASEGALYPKRKAVESALLERMRKGTYDASKAPKLWLYYVTEGARLYFKEWGVKVGRAEREYVANELARAFEVECEIQRNARSLPRADPEFMPSTYYDA
jgi:hypothetical protein